MKRLPKKSTAHLILLQTTKTAGLLANWLHMNLSEHEELNIFEWVGNRFYFEVKDTRGGWGSVENMRCWFTVDLKNDVIMWNDTADKHQVRGNCGVRTNKWKTLLLKWFDPGVKERVHWYKNRYLKKEV